MTQEQLSSNSPRLVRRSILAGLVALAAAGCGRREDRAAAAPPPAATVAASPPAAPGGAELVVTLLGDSITAGLGLPAADALPAQLETALRGQGLAVRVRAAGVSGDTTAGGLARVDFSVQDDTDLCIVALGGNDMLQGIEPARVRSNLEAILARLKARKIPVLLAGMRAPPQYGSYAADFDRVFTDLARTDGVAAYPFLLADVAMDARYNQADGIHPNAAGVRIIVERLAPVVAAALSRGERAVAAS